MELESYPFNIVNVSKPAVTTLRIASRSIASGGFGAIHEATSSDIRKEMVVKRLSLSSCSLLELTIMNSWHHRHLAKSEFVLASEEYGKTNDVFIMQERAISDLCSYMRSEPGTNRRDHQARVVEWSWQLATAIETLHSRDVIHGDIKPDNILVDVNSNVILADFGHAIYLPQSRVGNGRFSQTETLVAGTRPYMAPEIFARSRWSFAVDVWSLGCVIYEMYYKQQLFHPGPREQSRQAEMYVYWSTCHGLISLSKMREDLETSFIQLHPDFRQLRDPIAELIHSMLNADSLARPRINQVRRKLESMMTRVWPYPPLFKASVSDYRLGRCPDPAKDLYQRILSQFSRELDSEEIAKVRDLAAHLCGANGRPLTELISLAQEIDFRLL